MNLNPLLQLLSP